MKKTVMRSYAKLIVRVGANVQKGQEVRVFASLDQPEFIKMLAEECYKAGASRVTVDWNYPELTKLSARYMKLRDLSETREWEKVIANQGHTGAIMDAARAAGAGGGTVIHAKGTGMEGAAQFLGVELVNEKELVLIVARTPEKNRIMKAIMDGAGPKAGAIVFSLPVTDTAGLRLLEDEEPVQETSAQ